MNDPDLMISRAREVKDASSEFGIDLSRADLVEVGPGHSLGSAIALIAAGAASVTALDVYPFVNLDDPELGRSMLEVVRQGDLAKDPEITPEKIREKLSYSIVSNDGAWPLPDESKSVVYSYYSGEHLRKPEAILAETYRVLKPGGLCMHKIDLRDHDNHDRNWLQFLYYEPWLWEAMSSRRGLWCNRHRAPAWHDMFAKSFEVLSFQTLVKPIHEDFRQEKLASPFRKYDLDTLSIEQIWVVARKRA